MGELDKRSVVLLVNVASRTGATNTNLPVPSWARQCVIHVLATAAATGTFVVKAQQKNPDGSGTFVDTGATTDTLTGGATPTNLFMTLGNYTATGGGTPGAGYDVFAVPLSKYMRLVDTQATAAVTNVKIWAEFIG